MNTEDRVIERLDKVIAILQLAFADSIEKVRSAVRQDRGKAAILDACADGWTPSASARAAAKTAGIAEASFQSKAYELIAAGLLERRGATKTVEYRARGLV